MTTLDPRTTAARPELADERLRGRVAAEAFMAGRPRRVRAASAPLKGAPRPDVALVSEAVHGEAVTAFDEEEGWVFVQLEADGYVGWMSADALGPAGPAPTHRVTALRTLLYPALTIKAEPIGALSLGAQVRVSREEGGFSATPGGFIYSAHLAALTDPAPDFVAVAERFAGVPYLWGGKTSLGIDCSGLMQVSLGVAGVCAPRDSDMQQAAFGRALPLAARDDLARGDLVFWKGHVGVMQDASRLLHANAFHMAVASEPLAEAEARIAARGGGPVLALRRL